ncbi:metallophosphoesterase family protein [Cryptosporangium aurantiacum]|uniref:metallophosphoesterase family protein n=1 Tax=Cryptosporangium aurantiacum TaxID=134849 RepID=UPI000934EB5B|nr:metallophosphoesterase [Cryptosporangium aurantiacum]
MDAGPRADGADGGSAPAGDDARGTSSAAEGTETDAPAHGRHRLSRLRRLSGPRWLRTSAAIFLVALIGATLGLQLGGRAEVEIGPFQMQLAAQPSLTGGSQLRIPPLGAISIQSHRGPIRLVARVDGLNESETRQLIADPARIEEATDLTTDDVRSAVTTLALRSVGAGLLGALLLGAVAFRSVRKTLITGGVALVLLGGSGGLAAATVNPASLSQPRYEGLLTNVPALIGDARSIYDNYGQYQGQLVQILTNMSKVYEAVSTLPTYQPDPNTIRVMHVSDLHNNPTAWSVIGTIGSQFQVNAVFDTGDLTDWGSAAEANLYASNVAALKVPYVFIRGNHDSGDVATAVAANPNAVVLDDQVQTVAGLVVAGVGSSRFTPDKSTGDDDAGKEVEAEAGEALSDTVLRYNRENEKSVDVMMVHEPAAADPLKERGPLILAGHTHERKTEALDKDTLLMIEGSTGAAGLRGFQGDTPKSFEMTVLYFAQDGALKAYDEITVSGAGQSQVELRRVIIGQKNATPSATVTATPSGTVTVSPSTPPNTAPVIPSPSPTTPTPTPSGSATP